MNHQQNFLKAIRRRPGSSAQRLVYADWLSEQGDPRGDFIRSQVQACKLPSGSPQRCDLEAQARDLLRVHEQDWLGPWTGIIGNWEWKGGMLDWVTVAADVFLQNAERCLPETPVLGIHLRKAHGHIAELARCPQLAHVSGLYLGDNSLTDDDLATLLQSPYLPLVRSLYLQSNNLTAKGIRTLAQTRNLPRLRTLCVGHNRLGEDTIAQLANSPCLRRLRNLHLTLAFLEPTDLELLAESPLMSQLRELTLGLNQLAGGSLIPLVRAPAFARVRTLGYELNRPDDSDIVALAGSPHVVGLRHLTLDATSNLSNKALTALASSPHLRQLRSLRFGPGTWGPTGCRKLGRSRMLPSLRMLRLPSRSENVVPQALLGQPLIRQLRRIDLETSNLGTAGLTALASHRRPLRLLQLRLALTPEQADSWETLLAKKLLPELTDLSLQSPPSGALRAMLAPGRLPELRRLALYGVPDLEEFQALLASPLLAQLHELRINLEFKKEEKQGIEVIRMLSAAWNLPSLFRLGLMWSLSPAAARLLAASSPPPAVTELEVGVYHMKAEGMAALAGWPLLRQLRHLVLSNSSSQNVPGLEALADSPYVSPLLRVDIHNGHVPAEAVAAIRRRFGSRFAISGRMTPRTITLGGWGHFFGDGED